MTQAAERSGSRFFAREDRTGLLHERGVGEKTGQAVPATSVFRNRARSMRAATAERSRPGETA